MNIFRRITKKMMPEKKVMVLDNIKKNKVKKENPISTKKIKKNINKSIADIKYSLLPIITGSDLSQRKLPLMYIKSKNEGPIIWITACMHGDEVGGMAVIQEVFNYLKKHGLLKGEIRAIPLLNSMGFEYATREVPITNEDMNRVFPGDKNGTLAERIVYKIFKLITDSKPDLVLDLHNDLLNSVPYALIDPIELSDKNTYNKVVNFAKKSGWLVVDDSNESSIAYKMDMKKTFTGSLVNKKIPAITMEVGPDKQVHEKFVDMGVNAILNILKSLDMTEGEPVLFEEMYSPKNLQNQVLQFESEIQSSKSGLVRYVVEEGNFVKKGDVLAKIYNPFGRTEETIFAPKDGFISGHNDLSISSPGKYLYSLMSVKK
jgi:predicted deacylase